MHKESNKYLLTIIILIFIQIFNINLISVENKNIKENYEDIFLFNDDIFKNDLFLKNDFRQDEKKENTKEEIDKLHKEIFEEKEEERKEIIKEEKEKKKHKQIKEIPSKKNEREKIKEKVDKKNKNIKIEEFISFDSNEGNYLEITPEFKEITKREKIYKPYIIENFIEDYNIDVNNLIKQDIKRIIEKEDKKRDYEKLQLMGIIILVMSILIALSLLVYNYRKILLYNLKNLDNEVKIKAQQFYKNLLQTPENYKKKSKKEIIEELRRISRNK